MNSIDILFNNKFYRQINGLPMGDPCSPILGAFVFYDLEKQILDKFDFEISFYGRYDTYNKNIITVYCIVYKFYFHTYYT